MGELKKAQEVNRVIARNVDVMIGNEEDFTACLGFEVEGVDENISNIEVDKFKNMIKQVVTEFTNFKATATTLRSVKTATVNDWGAICWEKWYSMKRLTDQSSRYLIAWGVVIASHPDSFMVS